MKLSTNFADPVDRWICSATLSIWIVALFLAGGNIWIAIDTQLMDRQNNALMGQQESLQIELEKLSRSDIQSSLANIISLKEKIQLASQLSKGTGIYPTTLLHHLEGTLPPNVLLESVSYKQETGTAAIIARAIGQRGVTKFLSKLEKNPLLKYVELKKQQRLRTEGKTTIRFELQLGEKPR